MQAQEKASPPCDTGSRLAYGIHPADCVQLEGITAVGGGMVRDVLLAQIPVVLRVDIYAAAALRRPSYRRATHHRRHLGGALCFTLRMLAVWQNWQLPKAGAF